MTRAFARMKWFATNTVLFPTTINKKPIHVGWSSTLSASIYTLSRPVAKDRLYNIKSHLHGIRTIFIRTESTPNSNVSVILRVFLVMSFKLINKGIKILPQSLDNTLKFVNLLHRIFVPKIYDSSPASISTSKSIT